MDKSQADVAFADACRRQGVDYKKAMDFRRQLHKEAVLLIVAEKEQDAIVHWNNIHDIQRAAKKNLKVDILPGTPSETFKKMKNQVPKLYDACIKWGFIHE